MPYSGFGDPASRLVAMEQEMDDFENSLGDKVGHPEACWYTMKATQFEIIEHFATRQPECDGFTAERR